MNGAIKEPPQMFDTVIVWFRRDMRVDDNPALSAALQLSKKVVPLFIWAPEEEGQFQPGRTSRWWSKQSVLDLQVQVAALGSRLVLRQGKERWKTLLQVFEEVDAQAVFFNNLYDPISLVSDHEIKIGLTTKGVTCKSFNSDMLYEPWEVVDEEGQPCTTFDDFWNRATVKEYPPPMPVPAPVSMPPVDPALASESVEGIGWFMNKEQGAASDQLRFKWKPGTPGAIAKLEAFFGGKLHLFDAEQVKVDRESTSQLSPWIHAGSISIRYIFYRTKQFELQSTASGYDKAQCCSDFLRQLGYREYARYLAYYFPFIHERSLLSHLRSCPYRLDNEAFKHWRQGQTGYPLVDAAMKQLWSTGWAHNRLRIIAASFLVKNLLLPWQWGLKHFWDCQLDADLENDALGWQYISGGMADAHPFSFIIDLSSECARLDPDGEYVRRWLPALALLPTEYIHAPWTAPQEALEAADIELGLNYPKPIISIHESILSLQHAVDILDSTSSAAASEGTTRHPYRQACLPLKEAPPLLVAGALVSCGGTIPTGGTVGGTEEHFEYPSGIGDRTVHKSWASGSSGQHGGGGASGHQGAGMSGQQTSGSFRLLHVSSAEQGDCATANSSGTAQHPSDLARPVVVMAQIKDAKANNRLDKPLGLANDVKTTPLPGTFPPAGFDYPRYRQSHGQHQGQYIDVRLVPAEEVKAMADAAAYGRLHPLKHIPGMRDDAVRTGVMARLVRDVDSSWAPAPGPREVVGGDHHKREASSSSDDDQDDCMSEEVVSNTVGLSMPQASGFSGQLGTAAAAMRSAAVLAQLQGHGGKVGPGKGGSHLHEDLEEDVSMADGNDEVGSGPVRAAGATGYKRTWSEVV